MNCELLESLRKQCGYSQQYVSEYLGLSSYSSYIYKLQHNVWDANNIVKLCHLYGCEPNDLLGWSDQHIVLLRAQLRQEEYALMRKALERI